MPPTPTTTPDLRADAQRQAEQHGHRLGPWESLPGGDFAECERCGLPAQVRRGLAPRLVGAAVTAPCPVEG